ASRLRIVRGLHAKKNNLRPPHRAQFRGRFHSHTFLNLQRIQKKSVLLDSLHKRRPPDHHYRRARTRQQSSEVSAHSPRPNDGNLWPGFLLAHGVTTLMSRSMSRSVLYKCGETRMFPSRKLTTT